MRELGRVTGAQDRHLELRTLYATPVVTAPARLRGQTLCTSHNGQGIIAAQQQQQEMPTTAFTLGGGRAGGSYRQQERPVTLMAGPRQRQVPDG